MPILSDCRVFTQMVEQHFAFLEEYGFKRAPQYEAHSPTGCTVVYLGKHVAIRVYLDIRDDYVGVTVVKVIDGVPRNRLEGGYHADLGTFLMQRGRYRRDMPTPQLESPIERAIASWADLLRSEGEAILADLPDSLD